jgi:hypothetical protein
MLAAKLRAEGWHVETVDAGATEPVARVIVEPRLFTLAQHDGTRSFEAVGEILSAIGAPR